MGQTPILQLPYPEPADPADVPTDMNELASRIEAVRGASPGLASLGNDGKVPAAQLPPVSGSHAATPPASPADGELWFLPVAAGVLWMFRFNAAGGTFPWEFVGGPPAVATNSSGGPVTAANAWFGLSGTEIVVPRAGDYRAMFGARINLVGGSTQDAHLGVANASVAPDNIGLNATFRMTPAGPTATVTVTHNTVLSAIGANMTVRLTAFVTSTDFTYDRLFHAVYPTRVS